MRAERTQYTVPGWGTGTLWTSGDVVLAHEFDFLTTGDLPRDHGHAPRRSGARPSGTAAHEGARNSPAATRDDRRSRNGSVPSLHRLPVGAPDRGRLEPGDVVASLTAFFGGEDALRDVPLDLSWCTPFQRSLTQALRDVPRGEVVSYGELAALAGYPNAARAAGTLCARNRFVLLVPCHRVLAADGIGGYGAAGIAVKRRLLALEGVIL
ncbi:MAG TPA: methylated-DNA--[protein]-cysteine S-methyltransferase [Gaiellaceae bacterium]|nr:methylated-DNA--[protein]-cysteine S-methyltransferase [Gaiellaceae bacterium]